MYLAEVREWTTLKSSQRWVQQGVPSSNIFRPCQELEDEFPPGIGQWLKVYVNLPDGILYANIDNLYIYNYIIYIIIYV